MSKINTVKRKRKDKKLQEKTEQEHREKKVCEKTEEQREIQTDNSIQGMAQTQSY